MPNLVMNAFYFLVACLFNWTEPTVDEAELNSAGYSVWECSRLPFKNVADLPPDM